MPELPEVELMSRRLDAWLSGAPLSQVVVHDEKLGSGQRFAPLAGEEVERAWRRAKYAVVELQRHALIFHFRMTGKVLRSLSSKQRPRLTLVGARETVHFCDTRRFGTADLVAREELDAWFAAKKVGPEPYPLARDGLWWRAQIGHLRTPLKNALMRQDAVAGLGNILASELLWRARIHPEREPATLVPGEWEAIAAAFTPLVEDILRAEDQGDEIVYIGEGREPTDASFGVYQREGEPAFCCGEPVVREVHAGRSTFYCPRCQR